MSPLRSCGLKDGVGAGFWRSCFRVGINEPLSAGTRWSQSERWTTKPPLLLDHQINQAMIKTKQIVLNLAALVGVVSATRLDRDMLSPMGFVSPGKSDVMDGTCVTAVNGLTAFETGSIRLNVLFTNLINPVQSTRKRFAD
ncbi:MAG TPA: hypothetical protein VFY06_12395 [Verrucomicrobiae bacterium]|nr:hypothetical protein [Verrucomicrobiae bacterium]